MTVIILSNFDNGSAAALERDLTAAVFRELHTLPSDAPEVRVAHNVLAAYEGLYRTEHAGRAVGARVKGEHLCVTFLLLPTARLRALSVTRFQGRLKGGEVTFDFVFEEERVVGVALDWSGTKLFAPKTG